MYRIKVVCDCNWNSSARGWSDQFFFVLDVIRSSTEIDVPCCAQHCMLNHAWRFKRISSNDMIFWYNLFNLDFFSINVCVCVITEPFIHSNHPIHSFNSLILRNGICMIRRNQFNYPHAITQCSKTSAIKRSWLV